MARDEGIQTLSFVTPSFAAFAQIISYSYVKLKILLLKYLQFFTIIMYVFYYKLEIKMMLCQNP